MMDAEDISLVATESLDTHLPAIGSIQRRQDGTYVIAYGGYPFHATLAETPDIYERVMAEIKNGAPVTKYVEPEISKPDPLAMALEEYGRLRNVADFVIAPLQDAVDDGEATEAEAASLKAWRKYRIALSRVSDQEGYPQSITWPVAPA